MAKKLPDRPQWFRDMVARLRGERKTGVFPPEEFLEHAADEAWRHPDYLRFLARADVSAYDKAVDREQRADLDDEMMTAQAQGYIKESLFPEEVLAKLGLDPKLQLGFDRSIETADASHEDRVRAIAELERKKKSWAATCDRQIAAIEALDELAGDKTLREIVAGEDDTVAL